jgi:hypothetical protein
MAGMHTVRLVGVCLLLLATASLADAQFEDGVGQRRVGGAGVGGDAGSGVLALAIAPAVVAAAVACRRLIVDLLPVVLAHVADDEGALSDDQTFDGPTVNGRVATKTITVQPPL